MKPIKKLIIQKIKPFENDGYGPDDPIDEEKELNLQIEEEIFTVETPPEEWKRLIFNGKDYGVIEVKSESSRHDRINKELSEGLARDMVRSAQELEPDGKGPFHDQIRDILDELDEEKL